MSRLRNTWLESAQIAPAIVAAMVAAVLTARVLRPGRLRVPVRRSLAHEDEITDRSVRQLGAPRLPRGINKPSRQRASDVARGAQLLVSNPRNAHTDRSAWLKKEVLGEERAGHETRA